MKVTDEELEKLAGEFMEVTALMENAAIRMKGLNDKFTNLINGKEQENGCDS